MGAAIREAELLLDPLHHVVAERVAELVGVDMRLGSRVAHEVGEQPLDQAVLADDPLGALDPGLGQDRLLLLAALDETLGLEPLQHLAGRRARDAEHVGDARGDRRRAAGVGLVLADRKGEEVDRLEVFVHRVAGHSATLAVLCRLGPVPCRKDVDERRGDGDQEQRGRRGAGVGADGGELPDLGGERLEADRPEEQRRRQLLQRREEDERRPGQDPGADERNA